MIRLIQSVIIVLLYLVTIPSPRAEVQNQPIPTTSDKLATERLEAAVESGLSFLAKTQLEDGGWSCIYLNEFRFPGTQPNTIVSDAAVTSLSVMAFLSAGHVPGEGPYSRTISNGIQFVLRHQQKSGLFPGSALATNDLYYHGICTLLLAEIVGMAERKFAEEVRTKLQLAVKLILQSQRFQNFESSRDHGGWRYSITSRDADVSVTGWQIMALRAAKNVGCDVPTERIRAAIDYIRRCHDTPSGGFRYMTNSRVTTACTGVGILCLELSGKEFHDLPESRKAGDYLLKTSLTSSSEHIYYTAYYAAQGTFQLGGAYWKNFRTKLHELFFENLPQNFNGAWGRRVSGRLYSDEIFGSAYSTSMAILALTVEYRLLPIYQRFDEPVESPDE